MTLEIGLLFALLLVMVTLFLTEKLPVDLTAFCGLVVLVFAGFVKPEEAFTGFASNAVITMLSVFFVSAALQYTGVAKVMGAQIHKVVGSREVPLIIAVMLVAGLLSAFMNNIAAAAVLMPAVSSLARQARLSPARLMMPLAFGSILGGTSTLVGTPPNLLTAQVLTERGLTPFTLFEFAPYGLCLLGVGILFMVTLGRRLLPAQSAGMAETERSDLAQVYRLKERLFSLDVPQGSSLVGQTLSQARIHDALGLQVVAIDRGEKEQIVPGPNEVLRADDRLIVEGRQSELEARLEMKGLQVRELGAVSVGDAFGAVGGIVVRLRAGSPLLGRSLKALGLRTRQRVAVAAIWRDGVLTDEHLGDLSLRHGDEVLALGERERINELGARPDLEVLTEGPAALERLEAGVFLLRVPAGSHLVGVTIAESKLRERFDLNIVGFVRGGEVELVVSPKEKVSADDELLVVGQPIHIMRLLQVGQVAVADGALQAGLESDDIGLVEAVVAPRSAAVGRSLKELDFRKRFGLRALAVWRRGRPIRSGVPDQRLQLGDGVLLHGPREKVPLIEADPDFVVLSSGADGPPPRTARAPFAVGALLMMVGLVVSGLFPIQVAAFAAATLVVLTGALKMQEAYRAVEWRAVFLVAAILPVGVAMERTGAAELIASTVATHAGGAGPYAVLVALMILSSLLSQGLDGAPTVVLLGPVVVGTAQRLSLSPYPLMMGVGLAASAAFMTPFSHKVNLLVMGAGGYRAMDYVKVGAPLTLVVLGLLSVMIPWLMPLTAS
jgi:di/tricarboxylate transporter